MAKGVTARSLWQEAAKKHAAFSKQHPEWMGQANEALKPWGDQEVTLQHAIAEALKRAYEAGARGEYPKPIDYFDRYKEQDREDDDDSGGSSRIVRRSRTAPPDAAMGHVAASNGVGSGHTPRRARTPAPAETGGEVHRIVRSRPAEQPANPPRFVRTRS